MPKTIKEKQTESKPKVTTTSSEQATTSVLMKLSQQFNLLAILLIALFLFQAYTFYKLKNIETTGVAGTQQQESPLSQENLVAAAKDLSMDEKKFEQCLTSEDKKAVVQADMAQASELGVQGTPGFFINGRFLGGAFPFEAFKEIIDKEIAGTATDNCTDYSEEMQQYCSDPANAGFIPAAREIALGDSPSKGPTNAKVTIVEFSDFECPFCQRAFPTVQQILDTYPNDVRLVYKQLPLTNIHPNAERAALASECARDQGKFWEMHDRMFDAQI
ncbi:MAG TPA: thioredoxin domain-containing protein [Candidatus Woesebacteria bacterium]|nr:thioredoxin domain-containing protein [Candidatus Woesebacteria bacterium]